MKKQQPSSSLQEHYDRGYEAFSRAVKGKKGFWFAMSNPLKVDTTPAREWQRGYDAAYFDNLKGVTQDGLA